jgi:hypothetical protein
MPIDISSNSSSYIGATKWDENILASSAMVQSLLAAIKNKIVIQNNNLGLAFERRMMFYLGI